MVEPSHATNFPTVLFLPDALLPVETAYRYLLEYIQGEIQVVLKDLEVYRGNSPPPMYGLEMEIEAIKQTIGDKKIHLVGFSGGGGIGLAFLAKHPDQVKSVVLIEPAWVGNDNLTQFEKDYWLQMDRIWCLPIEERINAFVKQNLRDGVAPPPSPPPTVPSWFNLRPVGFAAIADAFSRADLCKSALAKFSGPVYLAVGGLSHSIEQYKANTLLALFPHIRLEVFPDCHHFDPPHRSHPERFASILREFWKEFELS
jgi:pimeloyl-ACP methyl ester carboxylesterase